MWKRWVKPTLNSGSEKAGTVISYLTTFEKFLTYVTNPRYNRSGLALHPDFIDIFRQVLPEIKGWRSTVDSHTQAEQNQRFMDESDALLTPAEKAQLKTSEPYVEGLKAINQADQGKMLSLQEYVSARDLLLAIFSIDNGSRPGLLNNATLKDYETTKTEKGNRIMLVARHKQSKEGPAILGMTQELQQLMEIYIQKIRPQFAPQSENHLFLRKEGQPFPEGTIRRRTRAFFLKTKLRIGEKLANVSVRKFVSTKTKEWATPEEAAIVKRLMCHSHKTAERAYVRTSLTKLGSQALDIIARITTEEKPEPEKGDDINTEKQPASANEVKPSTRTKVVEESTPDANESPCSMSRPVAPPAAANQSTDKIESTSSVSGLTAPPAVSKQFTNSQKEGESVADPIESASFVSGLVAPPPAAKQLTRSQMEGKSTPDPQEPPSMHSSSFVPATPEKKLTDKQKEAIKNLFEQDTKNKTDFTLKYVRNKCCTSSVLGQLALQKKSQTGHQPHKLPEVKTRHKEP